MVEKYLIVLEQDCSKIRVSCCPNHLHCLFSGDKMFYKEVLDHLLLKHGLKGIKISPSTFYWGEGEIEALVPGLRGIRAQDEIACSSEYFLNTLQKSKSYNNYLLMGRNTL